MKFKGEIVKTMLMALVVGALLWVTPGFTQGFKGFGSFKGFGMYGKGFGGFGRGRYGSMRGYNNMNGKNRIVDVSASLEDLIDPTSTLKPYATVGGTVFGEDGKPASNITVTISRQDSKGEYKTSTKKDGQYSYDGLPAGEYMMGVIYNLATRESDKGDAGLLRDVTLRIGRIVTSDFDLKEFVSMGKPSSYDELKKLAASQMGGGEDLSTKLSLENQELYDKARDAADKGDFATAAMILQQLVQREPKEAVFWNRLGEAYLMLKKYPEGVAAFRQAVELKPENAGYSGNLAMGLLFTDKIDEAIIYTEKTAALDPKRGAAAYYNLGLALTDKGDAKQAEAAFEKSTKLDGTSENADSFYQLGITLLSTHTIPPLKITDAIPHLDQFRKWVEKDPERQVDAQTALALINEISKPATTGATNTKASANTSTNNGKAAASTGNGKAASGSKK